MTDFDYASETPEESWNYFTNYSNLEDFLEFPTKLSEIEEKVEEYIEEIPNRFTIKITEEDKEIIKVKFMKYIDELLRTNCINCFHHHGKERVCPNCGWINDLDDSHAVDITPTPIAIRTYTFDDFTPKTAYPPLDKKHIKYLPEKLGEAVVTFFKNPKELHPKDKNNIVNNLHKKNPKKFEEIYKRYKAKAVFASFLISDSNFDKI